MYCRKCNSYIPTGLNLAICPSCQADLKTEPPAVSSATIEKTPQQNADCSEKPPRKKSGVFLFIAAVLFAGFCLLVAYFYFADSKPVLLILGNHGDANVGFLEQESDADRTLEVVKKHFENVRLEKNEKIRIWRAYAIPPGLAGTVYGTKAQQDAFYALIAQKLHIPSQIVFLNLISPEGIKDEKKELFLNVFREIYKEAVRNPPDKETLAKQDPYFIDAPIQWLIQKFGKDKIQFQTEAWSFEGWFEMVRVASLQYLSAYFLESGKFDKALKMEYLAMEAMIRDVRLRDQILAEKLAEWSARKNRDYPVVMRALDHIPLEHELKRRNIDYETAIVGEVKELTAFEQHVYAALQSNRSHFDVENISPEDRKFLWIGIMERLVEVFLQIRKTPLSRSQRSVLFEAMIQLDENQIEKWLSLMKEVVPRGELAPSVETVNWLRKVNPRIKEMFTETDADADHQEENSYKPCNENMDFRFDNRDWVNVSRTTDPQTGATSVFVPAGTQKTAGKLNPEQFVYKGISGLNALTPRQYWAAYIEAYPKMGVNDAKGEILKDDGNDLTASVSYTHEAEPGFQVCRIVRGCFMHVLCYTQNMGNVSADKKEDWLQSLSGAKLVSRPQ